MRILLALLIVLLTATPSCAERFVAITFHDVLDDERDLGPDDISTPQLVAFLEWLKGNDLSPVSLDDIEAARAGTRPLPPHAILLTFDDGYESAYSRVYPLLLAYRFHAVFTVVGSWMEARPDGKVRYGDKEVPRTRFLSWEQAREMAASGLVEFASHSYDLHRGIRGNPQGSMTPSAATWAYDPRTMRYETDAQLQARVFADLQHSAAQMRSHLGQAPRALAWPYGRFSGPALAGALQAGFRDIMVLTPEPADVSVSASRIVVIPRLYPSQNPFLKTIAPALRFAEPDPDQHRVVCVDMAAIAGGSAAQADAALGRTIEDVRRLGANTVVLDPVADRTADGRIQSVWFHSALLPAKADFLGFATWQLHSRAGASVFLKVDLHVAAASVGSGQVAELIREIVRVAPLDGIVLDPPGAFLAGGAAPTGAYPWSVRAARDALRPDAFAPDDRAALDAWRVAEDVRPGLRLAIIAPPQLAGPWPAPAADLVLLSPAAEGTVAVARSLASHGWLAPDAVSRLALPLPQQPGALVHDIHQSQALGASAFALCPAPVLPLGPQADAAFSAARFPQRP